MLKGDQTVIGGTVRNISNEDLSALAVELELRRRKDGKAERALVTVEPSQLKPQQEGRYSLQLRSADYSSAKVVILKSGETTQVAFAQLPGQKRPPEKIESKVVTRPGSSNGGFLNTPDKPMRVP
jgi:outer membrane PBP1 activator LpoA protein